MTPSSTQPRRLPFEELILYALLIGVGAIPISNAIEAGGPIGVEPTIGFLMIGLGSIGVIAFAWRWRRSAQPDSEPEATGSRKR